MAAEHRRPHRKSRRLLMGGTALLALATALPVGGAWAAPQDELLALVRAQQEELKTLRREMNELKHSQRQVTRDVKAAASGASATAARAEVKAASAIAQPAGRDGPSVAGVDLSRYVEKGRTAKTFRVPGTDFDIKAYGFVKADVITRLDGETSGAEDLFVVPAIVTTPGANGTDDDVRVHGRESRLAVELTKPTSVGNFRALIEGDFFGAGGTQVTSNSDSFRLRHAWGELGGLGAGQFWSTFANPTAYIDSLDFQGAGGRNFIRQGLVRYTHDLGDGLSIAGAVENPETLLITSAPGPGLTGTSSIVDPDENVPDFVLRGRIERGWGHLQAAGLVGFAAGPESPQLPAGLPDAEGEVGYSLGLSGRINVPAVGPKDNLRLQLTYADGHVRYIQDAAIGSGDIALNLATNEIDTIQAYSAVIAYQHYWTDALRSTAAFSYVDIEPPGFVPGGALTETQYALGNLVWAITPEVELGVELQYGRRENENGSEGDATRFQSSVAYRF